MIFKNRTKILIATQLVLFLTSLSSCNRNARSREEFSPKDIALKHSVEEQLEANPRLRGVSYDLQVEAQDGAVTLTGETDTLKDALLAEQVAAKTHGVSKVANNIHVRTVRPALDQTGFNPELVRDQAKANGENIGESPQDPAIYFRLRQLLVDTRVTPKEAIFVDVVDQVVTLRGMVFSDEARDRAVAVASGMPEVRAVKDQLLVNALEPEKGRRERVQGG